MRAIGRLDCVRVVAVVSLPLVQVLVLVLAQFLPATHPLREVTADILRVLGPLLSGEVTQVYNQLAALVAIIS